MNKRHFENPEKHILFCEKSDWYDINEEGKRDWSKSETKVDEFWKHLNQHIKPQGNLILDSIIFPYKPSSIDIEFNETDETLLVFRNVKFEGEIDFFFLEPKYTLRFIDVEINDRMQFSICEFNKFEMSGSIVNASLHFSNSSFQDFNLIRNSFWEGLEIVKCEMFKTIILFKNSFFGPAAMYHNTFKGQCEFKKTYLDNTLRIDNCSFENRVNFEEFVQTSKSKVVVNSSNFSESHAALFLNWYKSHLLHFNHILFNKNVEFLDCDFTSISFDKCDLKSFNISNCSFNRSKITNRILFNNESYSGHSSIILKINHYKMVEEVYRQLKYNQIQERNWDTAGDLYRSEMTMKRKRMINEFYENNSLLFFNILILNIYDIFSGFQQSILRPLIWLFITWLGFSFLLHSYQPQPGFNEAMAKSFATMFPLSGKIETAPYPDHFYIKLVFERLISVILITFFVFSVRARLKQ